MTFFFINSLTQILTKSFLFLKRKLNIDQLCINTRKGKEKRKGKHTNYEVMHSMDFHKGRLCNYAPIFIFNF